MRDRLDTAVSATEEKSLTAEAKIRLGLESKQASVADLIGLTMSRNLDTSEERKDELRRIAEKIKMYRNRPVVDYVTKHIAL